MKEFKVIEKDVFNKMSRNEKRVHLAKDVLLRIKSEHLYLSKGEFFSNKYEMTHSKLKSFINTQQCIVCAKGAIFCSYVGIVNEIEYVPNQRVDNWKKDLDPLLKIFTRFELDLFETLYENIMYSWCKSRRTIFNILEYYQENTALSNLERIIDLMENIIENEGELIIDLD